MIDIAYYIIKVNVISIKKTVSYRGKRVQLKIVMRVAGHGQLRLMIETTEYYPLYTSVLSCDYCSFIKNELGLGPIYENIISGSGFIDYFQAAANVLGRNRIYSCLNWKIRLQILQLHIS